MKLIQKQLIISLLCLSSLFLTSSQRSNWELLGEKKINLSLDFDELKLGAKEGVYTHLKFKILDQPVFIHHITVQYGNGTEDIKVIKQKFRPGAESKAIDLPGNKRIIKKIKFLYKTNKKSTGRAKIVVLGK